MRVLQSRHLSFSSLPFSPGVAVEINVKITVAKLFADFVMFDLTAEVFLLMVALLIGEVMSAVQ